MVWASSRDFYCSVELLEEDEPGDLMGKCEGREANLFRGLEPLWETVGASDEEG